MPAYLTIVQCVPDPIIDERINVGVIVYGDGVIRSRFVSDWTRVECFGIEDVGFLKEFAERVRRAETSEGMLVADRGTRQFDESILARIIGSWSSSIQFSAPKGSLRDPEIVLADAAKRFLREDVPQAPLTRLSTVEVSHAHHMVERKSVRNRAAAAALVQESVTQGFRGVIDRTQLGKIVRSNAEIPGKLDGHHRVDVAVGNGHWHFALHGLSFEPHSFKQLESDYSRAAFAVSDIVQGNTGLKFGILLLPPTDNASARIRNLYERARQTFERAGAVPIAEGALSEWVKQQIAELPTGEILLSLGASHSNGHA